MNRRCFALAAACSSLALAACAHEQAASESGFTYSEPAQAEAPAVRQYADQDRDGRVTRAEAEADPALLRSFDKYDRNDDDMLDRAEFARLEADSRDGRRDAAPQESLDGGARPSDEPAPTARGRSLNRTGVDRPAD